MSSAGAQQSNTSSAPPLPSSFSHDRHGRDPSPSQHIRHPLGRPSSTGAGNENNTEPLSVPHVASNLSPTPDSHGLYRDVALEEQELLDADRLGQQPFPPVDLRMLDYVAIYDENLICPICRCPFVDPVTITECNHYFCRDCIRQSWASASTNPYGPRNNRKDCPSCRTPAKLGLRSSTNKILTNILDDMMVKCPNSPDGCPAHVKRAEIQDHVELYCGHAMVECPARNCKLLCRRKDSTKDCLHSDVCCFACQQQILVSDLEAHWYGKCPDREVICQLCFEQTSYKRLALHQLQYCVGAIVSCPGKPLGCQHEDVRTQAESHAKLCPLAALQPIFSAQKQRLDEQEVAQKQMSRRMKILESGFSSMRDILYAPLNTEGPWMGSRLPSDLPVRPVDDDHSAIPRAPQGTRPRSMDAPPNLGSNVDPEATLPNMENEGIFTSPLHHLLSMHESLREEVSRVSIALQELEGRQSVQILNDSLRTREEMGYLGAQLAGLSRQVHWLTSTQLQRQGGGGAPNAGNAAEMAVPGPGVEAAVNAVNTAVRGAARMMNSGREGMGLRRGSSEEGRTKL